MIKNRLELLNPRDIKLLIFDIDGVLTRFDKLFQVVKDTVEHFGVPYDDEYLKQEKSVVARLINESSFIDSFEEECNYFSREKLGISFERELTFLSEYKIKIESFLEKLFENELKFMTPFSQTRRVLELLHSEVTEEIVAVSNWLLEVQRKKIANAKIEHLIKHIYTCEYLPAKPNPTIFRYVLYDHDVLPSEVVMIGDSACDIMAGNLGINTVLISSGKKKTDIHAKSDFIVDGIGEVPKVFGLK